MIFEYPPLISGTLLRRYKRFLADVKLDTGEEVTAHCTNSGSMLSCIEVGAPVRLSQSLNPNRKLPFTWEMIFINQAWVGINTMIPNRWVHQALLNKLIPGFEKYDFIKPEYKIGESRLDFFMTDGVEKAFVEVKNVTLKVGQQAQFPDAVTERGLKHLRELMELKRQGHRAAMFYVVQRMDVDIFAPAFSIDKAYGQMLQVAYKAGVEVIPIQLEVSPLEVKMHRIMNFEL